MQLSFRILGPLEVATADGQLRLGGPRQRSVLALLLLDANRVVSIERLANELYGDTPPVSAVTQVHRQISELRTVLGGPVIETRPPGYRIVVEPDALDLQVFERRVDAASASGDPQRAAALYREALALWRGAPLADLALEPFAYPVIARLDELRLAALERCLESELEQGAGTGLVPELEQLVAEHPLRERLRGQLMVALYRAGRQPAALAVYRAGRDALVEAFGLEPTPALRELEARILAHDPGLEALHGARPAPAPSRTVLVAARAGGALTGLAALGRALAARGRHELLLTRLVEHERGLPDALAAARACRDELAREDVTSRVAAFVSHAPGSDLSRLASTHEAGVLLVDAADGLERDGRLEEGVVELVEHAPCDVALLAGALPRLRGPVTVFFSGGEHDWAAAELGAQLAAGASIPLRLLGARAHAGDDGTGATRVLASASIAIQQVLGIDVEPGLADPGPEGLVAAARAAGLTVVGLSPRWRAEGLGAARRALLATGSPVLLVHRGTRPGLLAPRDRMTRYTWTIASEP